MENDLMCRRIRQKLFHHQPIFKKRRAKVQFADLPRDLLCTVFSKLPLKDVVRTCVLSSKWKHMWTFCPKLRFDGVTGCSDSVCQAQHHAQKFINHVNAVLQQHRDKVVEGLEFKYGFDIMLVDHLDNLVDFVVSSRTKNLAFDLMPADSMVCLDRYRFPFERLDNGSISRLQNIQLSFAYFELPPRFSGFPNLRKLDLHFIRASQKDLQHMLSNCFNLEWLSLVRCHLDGELMLARPLPQLLYLCVAYCQITKLKLNAMKLKSFIYHGWQYPIDLGHSLQLKDVIIYFYGSVTLAHALTVLPSVLPSVQSLSLRVYVPLKVSSLVEYRCKFSQLKYLHLQLSLCYEDAGNILSFASFLRAAPFLEKLEIHFSIRAFPHFGSQPIRNLPRCRHDYLKYLHISGFVGSTGQLEFLLHIVENASILEVLTIETGGIFGQDINYEGRIKVEEITKRYLDGIILPNTNLYVL